MHKSRGDQHAGAKVPRKEECPVRNGEFRKSPHDDREATCCRADREDEEECEDVQGGVVVAYAGVAAAGRLLGGGCAFILSAAEFGVQEGDGEVRNI